MALLFFLPSPPFLYLAEDVLGFNEVPPVLNEDSMRRRMGVGVCGGVVVGGGGLFIAALVFLSLLPSCACETTQSRRHLPLGQGPLH